MRAITALQRAPEVLEREVRRQRLKKLGVELRVLGLARMNIDTLTLADLRAARTLRARALHPDLQNYRGGPARSSQGWSFRIGFTEQAPAPLQDAAALQEAMTELNAAYAAVRKALTAPIYGIRSP